MCGQNDSYMWAECPVANWGGDELTCGRGDCKASMYVAFGTSKLFYQTKALPSWIHHSEVVPGDKSLVGFFTPLNLTSSYYYFYIAQMVPVGHNEWPELAFKSGQDGPTPCRANFSNEQLIYC